MIYDLIVVGGGAAGFFGAIQVAEQYPRANILILEKSSKVLSKVRVSGGGRCNVTHACFNPFELADHYPRGEKQLKLIFKHFQAIDMVKWLADHGVDLKTEADNRMFPVTDSSETIIECFLNQAKRYGVKIGLGCHVDSILASENNFSLRTLNGLEYHGKKVLISVGGSPNQDSYAWLKMLGHTLRRPIPSLFTFNDSARDFVDLMGVSVPNAHVRIATTKFSQAGPLLITHWGLSGPAIIKLSAWAAMKLNEMNYQFTALVSWIGDVTEDEARLMLSESKSQRGRQRIFSNPLKGLPSRLWERLCEKAEINSELIWSEIPNRNLNKLMECLIRYPFVIKGKTTFKEEFVTCGGVPMDEIDLTSMQSKLKSGVYFAGEVLNIDGETGGFNFQAAWSTAFVAAKSIAENLKS